MKKPLVHQGGEVEHRGEAATSQLLGDALAATDGPNDLLTHGFHSYPARMHPGIAREIFKAFDTPSVLDPFCGSGTVLVEALVDGRRGFGVDLNPLAVRLARVKTDVRGAKACARFKTILEGVAERSEERVRTRVDSRAPLPRDELEWYDVHVLKELAGLREEIHAIPAGEDRLALEMLMSSIIVKVSKQVSDTSRRKTDEKRIRKGLTTEFFFDKGMELIERWTALHALASKSPRPKIAEADVRQLQQRLPRKTQVELVLTSPPYAGTYDYVDHHARRYPWLGLDPSRMRRDELGARRDFRRPEDTKRWEGQVLDMLEAIAPVLTPGGKAIFLVGDGQIGGLRINAGKQLSKLAVRAGLAWIASASQTRPDFTGGETRRESLVLLARPQS